MYQTSKRFPVHPYSMRGEGWFPRSIAWGQAEKFRKQAESNHGQTLERLAERGGLSPEEMLDAYKGRKLNFNRMPPSEHLEALALVIALQEEPHVPGN